MIVSLESARGRRGRAGQVRRWKPGRGITERRLAVLRCAAEGMSARESAAHLGISEQTVKNHLSRVLDEMGVDDRTAAVVIALQRGWLDLDSLYVRQDAVEAVDGAGLVDDGAVLAA